MPAFARKAPARSRRSTSGGGRKLPRELAAAGFVLAGLAAPAPAQQGSVRVAGTAQTVYGDPERLAGESRLEPDFAVTWLQPRRSGSFELDLGITRRGREPHLGRASVAWRDVKLRGATWTFQAGDFYFTPAIADYRFNNLTAPAVTLAGAAASARTARSSASLVVGRTTAWRNIFGSDPDSLGQNVAMGRAAFKPFAWLDLNARGSRVRTRDVKEFNFTIQASDQAGGGAHVAIGPAVHIVADGSYVSYTRAGSSAQVRDLSATGGASILHSRGWLQGNVSRFSPGEFPVVNYSLVDRRIAFAAGEHDVIKGLRIFGGWESFRGNLDPARAARSRVAVPESAGTRAFGGVRLHLFGRSSIAVRVEEGDRRTRRSGSGAFADSDTGVITGELQSRLGRVTSFVRYSRRENVESFAGGGYEQTDGTAQLFVNVSRDLQLFGTGAVTHNAIAAGGGSTYFQLGGGGQVQLFNRMLWLRMEGLAARNQDLLTQNLVARESFNLGVNGQLARNTTIGFNLFAERSPALTADTSPWLARSTLRLTRSFPTGSVRLPGASGFAAAEARARGTASVVGTIFADWDADGVADADEGPLEGIPVLLGTTGAASTSARGEFAFVNVPAGLQRVQVDLASLPVDFDPPIVASVDLELSRGETRRVAFGLVPLGTVMGRVFRDANANTVLDGSDEPMEEAVLVLDNGLRSEQVRKGRFRFEAVRSGSHTLELLKESLPEGATIVSDARIDLSLMKDEMSKAIDFLVIVEKRPEIRKVFPPKGGGSPRAAAAAAPPASAKAPAVVDGTFTIQVAALSQASRAQELAAQLEAAGQSAYVVPPDANDPHGLYRVRVGRFPSRAAAQRAVPALEKLRGERLWVTKAR